MIESNPLFPAQAILLDRDFEILYIGEKASRYLNYQSGAPTKKLLKLIHPDLFSQVASGLQFARENDETYERSNLPLTIDNHPLFTNLRIRQFTYPQDKSMRLLISFDENTAPPKSDGEELFIAESSPETVIQKLQEELFIANSNLQTKNEEYEATVEELCAANEELRENADRIETSEQNLRLINRQLAEKVSETTALNLDLKNLIEATSAAIIFLNRRLEIKRFTPPAAKLFDLLEIDLGRPITDFAHRFDYPDLDEKVQQVIDSGVTAEREISDDKGNFYLARLQPYKTGGAQTDGAVLNLIDITVHKKAEESLRQSEERLQMSQKLESIGRLAGGVAHDFNNMLTAIIGYSDLGLKTLEPAHPLRKYLEQIRKAGEQSAELTKQLLAFSRRQIMQPKQVSLNSIIADVENLLGRLIGEDVRLKVELESEEAVVQVDPGQLTQVIMNLVVNARDAMPRGGELTIKTSRAQLEENSFKNFLVVQPGAYVNLSVSDTGEGIPEEIRQHIFEPFYTTKKIGEGTGLGLATVYGIVKQLNGYITVESEIGRGTTFDIYLPLV